MPVIRPPTPTVVTPIVNSKKVKLNSREKQTYVRYQATPDDLKGKDTVNLERLARLLTLGQDNINDASSPTRSDPLGLKCILENVAITTNPVALRHTLNAPWKYAFIIHAYNGAAACTLVEVSPAPTQNPKSQYLYVKGTGSGNYDILICGG